MRCLTFSSFNPQRLTPNTSLRCPRLPSEEYRVISTLATVLPAPEALRLLSLSEYYRPARPAQRDIHLALQAQSRSVCNLRHTLLALSPKPDLGGYVSALQFRDSHISQSPCQRPR